MVICNLCGKTYARNWNLTRHVAECHTNPTPSRRLYNTEFPQVASGLSRGMKREMDSREAISEDEAESDDGSERDIFGGPPIENEDSDETDIEGPYNSSSNESDNCDSSTDYSSDADDEVSGGDVTHGEDDSESETYLNYARWRVPENGAYSLWRSQSRKPYIVRHRKWLKSLLNCKVRRSLIRNASDSQLEAITEVATNVLNGGAVMYITEFQFVNDYRGIISLMASESTTYSELRKSLLAPENEHVLPLLLLYAVPPCLKSMKTPRKPVWESDESGEVDETVED